MAIAWEVGTIEGEIFVAIGTLVLDEGVRYFKIGGWIKGLDAYLML